VDPASVPETASQDPAPIADGVVYSLDPRYVDLEKQVGWIASAVVAFLALLGTTVLLLVSSPPLWAGTLTVVAAFAVLVALTVFWQKWPAIECRYYFYRVDAEGLEIRRGVYFRAVTTVPRSRVQHTDVSQGPLQRRHGLATLTVHTAGTDNAQVNLPGLTHERALRIRDHLLPRHTDDAV
jgi:uncharacterized protein